MTSHKGTAQREAESMVEMLDFARRHGRKILEDQITYFGDHARPALQKLLTGEYLRKIEKRDSQAFYTLTSRGLNLFQEERKSQSISEELKAQIIENLKKALTELEVKPWEVMFHIIYVVGKNRSVTTGQILHYFSTYFGDIKGTSRANVYRNIKRLRMKGYIECEKKVYTDQSVYRLSEKGEEIFYMAKANATQKLRTSEEWDKALGKIFDRITDERKKDEKALFYTLDTVIPHGLENSQVIWVYYVQGSIYEVKGNFSKAEEVYIRMEAICEECEDTRGRAYALKGLGNVSFKKGKFTVAEQYYRKCLRIASNLEDTLLLSDVLNNLGSCLYARGIVDEALTQFEKALELGGNDTARAASALYNIGLCYARTEDLDKAKEIWQKSLNLYRGLEENVWIKWVEYNLREIDRRQKEEYLEKKYREAMETGTSEEIERRYRELVKFKMGSSTPQD